MYLAVRVTSLVNRFRKRVKRRSQTARKRTDGNLFCRDIEVEAYCEIDRYLGRKSKHIAAGRVGEGTKKGGVRSEASRVDELDSCDKVNVKR